MAMANDDITHARLLEVLHYDPVTGEWTWIVRTSVRMHIGDKAGRIANGRRSIQVDGKRYYAYRLAVFYMTGEWPHEVVDHENLKKSDDRWENLRCATKMQNNANAVARSSNKCGLKGVSKNKGGKFSAFIQVEKKNKYLGQFDCPVAAHFAYVIAADKAFGEFARAG